jgi:hypothetical protein
MEFIWLKCQIRNYFSWKKAAEGYWETKNHGWYGWHVHFNYFL